MKNKIKEIPKIEFRLVSILGANFNYNHPIKPFTPKTGVGTANFNVDPKVGFNIESNSGSVILNIKGKIIETDEDFFSASNTFIFEINNLKNILIKNEKNIAIFKNKKDERTLLISLLTVSYSTMRGIVFAKGVGTLLQVEMLPVVDSNVFLKKEQPYAR